MIRNIFTFSLRSHIRSNFVSTISNMSDHKSVKFKIVNCCGSLSLAKGQFPATLLLWPLFHLPPNRCVGPNPDAPNQHGCEQGSDGGAAGHIQHSIKHWSQHQHHHLELCLKQQRAGKDKDSHFLDPYRLEQSASSPAVKLLYSAICGQKFRKAVCLDL